MDILKQLGHRISQLRSQALWSQEELAERTGLHRTYISGLERGIRNPTLLVLGKIASAFSISPAELLTLDPQIAPTHQDRTPTPD